MQQQIKRQTFQDFNPSLQVTFRRNFEFISLGVRYTNEDNIRQPEMVYGLEMQIWESHKFIE